MNSASFFVLVYQGLYLVPPIRRLAVGSLSYVAFSLNVVVQVAVVVIMLVLVALETLLL